MQFGRSFAEDPFWGAALHGTVVTFGLEGLEAACCRKPVLGSGAAWNGSHFWPRGPRSRFCCRRPVLGSGAAYSSVVLLSCGCEFERRHARARARARTTRDNQRAPLAAHANQHTRTHTHQPTPDNTHAYTQLQDCMSDDSSPRAKT